MSTVAMAELLLSAAANLSSSVGDDIFAVANRTLISVFFQLLTFQASIQSPNKTLPKTITHSIRPSIQPPELASDTPRVVITSGKGGMGKTTNTANVGLSGWREAEGEAENLCGERLRLDGLRNPTTDHPIVSADSVGISVKDARKIMSFSQLHKVKSALKQIPTNSISYSQFLTVYIDICTNHNQGLEFSKMLDQAGDVIVLGNIVFLRPD